jgi:UDP-glucose 4-epimerase
VSILDLARRIVELLGSSSTIELVPYDRAYGEGFEEMRRRVPDNTRAERLIGFRPATGLDDIIRAVAADIENRSSQEDIRSGV